MDLKELGELADKLEAAKEKRIKADKRAAELKAEENRIKDIIIAEMETNSLSSVGGKSCVLNRTVKHRAIATDWTELYRYIKKHDAFDLLHKRLTDAAVKLREEDGVHVPGTALMEYSHLTYGKART
jgi:hypothetical protein